MTARKQRRTVTIALAPEGLAGRGGLDGCVWLRAVQGEVLLDYLSAVGCLVLVPADNAQGRVGLAATAGTLGQAVAIAWMLWAIAVATQTTLGSVFPWRDLAVRGLAAVAAAVPIVALRTWSGETLALPGHAGLAFGLAVRVALYLAAWLLLLRLADWVPAQDWQTLGRWARLEPLWRKHDS